eukprot:sb/3466315/
MLQIRKFTCCYRHLTTAAIHPLYQPLITGDRSALARAITLTESTLERHKVEATNLMSSVLSYNQQDPVGSIRIGISGPPGAGKSTFIEGFGLHLADKGHKVAVLAVDPSSSLSGGSLLADKTRMQGLSAHRSAFIRPSPSRGHLGGVARATNDAIQLCEAGGYDVILVETVGAGQSETAVANMTDLFTLLIPPGSGDELQGIKKGIVEVADMVVVTKADGNLKTAARLAKTEYSRALRLLRSHGGDSWNPFVMTVSALTGEGLGDVWDEMCIYKTEMIEKGMFSKRREGQRLTWMWNHLQDDLLDALKEDPSVRVKMKSLERDVRSGVIMPGTAAKLILTAFLDR